MTFIPCDRLWIFALLALAYRSLRRCRDWTWLGISFVIWSLVARANNAQSFRCKAPSSAATEKAAETGISRTFHENVHRSESRRPGLWHGAEVVTAVTCIKIYSKCYITEFCTESNFPLSGTGPASLAWQGSRASRRVPKQMTEIRVPLKPSDGRAW